MATREDDPVGGDALNRAANEFALSFIGTWSGFLGMFLAAALIVADLSLGPFFLYAQADHNGIELGLVAKITPWVFSVALTGLLYALWETIGARYTKQWIKWLAVAINIGDTLTDIGGANWLFTHDPKAGQSFLPPPGTPTQSIILIYVLGIACFFHEPLLGWLLGHYQGAVDAAAEYGEPTWGEKVELFLVKFGGVLMNTVKFFGKMGATFMLPALDIILTPLNITSGNTVTYVSIWVSSIGITAIQSRLWARTREFGGIKAAMEMSTKDRIMVMSLYILIIVDTYFDVRGYNQALYGEKGNWFNVISHPTQSWLVTIGILAALCSFGELLTREVFTILGRQAATIRKGGGGVDMGGPMGGDFGGPDDMIVEEGVGGGEHGSSGGHGSGDDEFL